MKHTAVREIAEIASVGQANGGASRSSRRDRLERLANLLVQHTGPARLIWGIEHFDKNLQMSLRAYRSPLSIAYQDPIFHAEGLKSDQFGDAMDFFGLTRREAHHLFCDCHYSANPSSGMVAERARSIARKTRIRYIWNRLIQRSAPA